MFPPVEMHVQALENRLAPVERHFQALESRFAPAQVLFQAPGQCFPAVATPSPALR